MAEDNTPKNVVDLDNQVAIDTEYGSGRDITVTVDKNGNVVLFRGTDDPNRGINVNFEKSVGRGEVGYGQGNYYSPNPQYAANYAQGGGRKLYGYSTDIKPNEIINFRTKISDNIELAKKLGVEDIYWDVSNPNHQSFSWADLFYEMDKEDVWNEAIEDYEVTKKSKYGRSWFQNNIDIFTDNGVKAFITTEVGSGAFTRAEIFPLVTETNNFNIKPVVQYSVDGAGKNLSQFTEIPLDTPTTIAGADVNIPDTPTNVVDDVVVTSATENLKQTIPTNADGNIVIYRATTDPNVNILSDFTDINMSNQAGLGQQSFYAIDEMYAYNYSRPSINKNVYKFETNIKPNQVLNIQSPTNSQLNVLEKIGITSQDLKNWDMFNTGEVNTKIQNNLDFLLENNIKAIGNNKVGGSPGVFDYEIVPIITEKTQTEIKPVSQLILNPNWEGTDRILNVENELFQSTQSTQWADKYLPIDVNDPNTKYRPVYYVDEEGIGRRAKNFQFSEQPLENNLVKDNLIEVPVDTNTNVNLVKDTYVLSTDTPGDSLGAAKLNDPLVFDSWVDNYAKTTTSFVDNLPLETVVKNRIKNLITTKTKQLAKPGSLLVKAVDAWEFGVIGLMAAGVAFNEIDEVPTIINNTAINMFNSMTAPYGIAPVEKEEYDIDYEFINTVLDTGSKVMPTDIIIEKLKPYSLEEGEDVILPGTGVTATTGAKQQFEPYGEELAKRAEKTVNMKRDEVKQKILESKGVQEEKMFEQAKPKKSSGGGSGAKIL